VLSKCAVGFNLRRYSKVKQREQELAYESAMAAGNLEQKIALLQEKLMAAVGCGII